jgi:integrase
MSSSSNKCESENTTSSKYAIDHEKKVLSDPGVVRSGNPPLSWPSEEGTGRPITPTAQAHLVPVRQMSVGSPAGAAMAVTAMSGTLVTDIAGAAIAPQKMPLETDAYTSMTMDTQKNVIEKSNDDEKIIDGETMLDHEVTSRTKKSDDEKIVIYNFAEIMKQAVEYTKSEKEQRIRRRNTKPSIKTIRDYEKKFDRILVGFNQAKGNYEERILAVFSSYAISKNSFKSMRAAIKFSLKEMMLALGKRAVKFNRESGRKTKYEQKISQHLQQILGILRVVDDLDRTEILEKLNRTTQRVRSKKTQLPLLKTGWQDRFLEINEKSRVYCDAGVLLRYCGLRPEELAKGVRVELKDGHVCVQIKGAKVRDGIAGQPWRTMSLNAEMLPQRFVEKIKQSSILNVCVSPDALRQHLKRTTEAVIGHVFQGNEKIWISAYMFRHSLVTEMRHDGWDEQTLATVLGELTVDTAKSYGRRVRAGTKHPSIAIIRSSVQAALPIKPSSKSGDFTFGKRAPKNKIGA